MPPKGTKKERLEKLDEVLNLKMDEAPVFKFEKLSLSHVLDLAQDSPIDMILYQKDSVMTPMERYQGVRKGITESVVPVLQKYLEDLKLEDELQKVKDLDQLSKTIVVFVPQHFKDALATHLDSVTGFELYQKVWMYDHFLNLFAEGVSKQVAPAFEKRAKQLMNAKRRIIVP